MNLTQLAQILILSDSSDDEITNFNGNNGTLVGFTDNSKVTNVK